MNYNGPTNYASSEIFCSVFDCSTSPAQVLAAAEEEGITPQDYIMTHVLAAQKCGMETSTAEAFAACCEECCIANS